MLCVSHADAQWEASGWTRERASQKGGNSGPAIVPGPASNSLLMQVVTHTHAKIKMPPGGRLSDAEIAISAPVDRIGRAL